MSVLSSRGLLALLVLSGGSVVACVAQTDAEPVGSSESRAVVTQGQADRAFQIVSGIDYLPWGYKDDGCYARALYMSMELAFEKIPSSSQYIYATAGGDLRPGPDTIYAWHVAPMIKVTATGTPMIIDPSLFDSPQVAHSLDAWVARNNPTPARNYGLALIQGSHYYTYNPELDSQPIDSFAKLDPFKGADIESACSIAYDYLADDVPTPTVDALEAKRAKLIDRTKTLITGLRDVEKLADLTAATLSCGGHANLAAKTSEEEPLPEGSDGSETKDPNSQ